MQNERDLKSRTKKFALEIIRLTGALPKTPSGHVIGNQLLRSGTSLAANYRAACRARSRAEFISKIGIVIEESDESVFWLELIVESNLMAEQKIKDLLKEANELTAIMVTSSKSARKNS
ncbi:MAG: four helix bundle protein [Candidatus Doudnabacteria bacterium RIFCSPHIGHO2_01_FULL_43_23]|uniref:Four helix bundle protein n=1 Tax=Candidatus Doudnabacteria bacterium RIFCSPHIGHO2_01_FULL_43_23 TaxID=1817822 RepID=A0A1F5NVY3_9BACT|nr:MAG: four helix bundle protein [Candidatus Doudnabacteria bacterium RIFCSPHIGHO2_01_FULL_43_23]